MAGIDFMAFADGMIMGDKLNKEDNDYWRKQQREDVLAATTERDQAFKEQKQGHELDDFRDAAQVKDTTRLVSQAYDTYAKAAALSKRPLYQVMMESPEFNIPGASPEAQSQFGAGMRRLIATQVAPALRIDGKFDEARALENKFGMTNAGGVGTTEAYTDPEVGKAFIRERLKLEPDANGDYMVQGVKVPQTIMIGLAVDPARIGPTLLNLQKTGALAAEQQTQRTQLLEANAAAKRREEWNALLQMKRDGYPEGSVPPELRETYRQIDITKPTQSGGASLVGSTVDAATSAPASAAPSTQSAVPATAGVSPAGGVTNRVVAPPPATQPAAPPDQWREVLLQANKVQSEVNNLESQRAALKKDLGTMDSLAGRKHFDPATIENARRQLADLNSLLSSKSMELDSIHAQVRQAPVARPRYVNILNEKYKVKQ